MGSSCPKCGTDGFFLIHNDMNTHRCDLSFVHPPREDCLILQVKTADDLIGVFFHG